MKYLFAIVFFWIGYSFTFNLHAGDTPYLGVSYDSNNNAALTWGDFNLFKPGERNYGLRRYGGGGFHFGVGNSIDTRFNPNLGVSALGNQGFIIAGLEEKEHNTLFPEVGFEAFNGRLNYNLQPSMQDYYVAFFGPSIGLMADVGPCRILPLFRAGGMVDNIGRVGILPSFDPAFGPAMHFGCGPIALSYGTFWVNNMQDKVMHDATTILELTPKTSVGAQYEYIMGRWPENTYSVFWRFK